jgi:chemotaxis protein CheD
MPHDDVNKIPFPAGTTVVRIGEVKTAGRDVILRATLGSCVGIGVLWRSRGLYALAHCLLPDAPPGEVADAGQGARYVTWAVPSLLRMLNAPEHAHSELDVVIAGGANMLHFKTKAAPGGLVGDQNVASARRVLHAAKLGVVHAEVGGEHARQLSIDGANDRFEVRTIEKP